MMGLTPMQARTLSLIRDYIASEGYAPALEEIRLGLGLANKGGAKRLLDGLEERGHIRRIPYRARAIELVGDGLDSLTDDALRAMRRRIDTILKGRAS